MKKLIQQTFQILQFILGAGVALAILACGPEQDSLDLYDDQIRVINEKETQRLKTVEGAYSGTMISFGEARKNIKIAFDIEIYMAPRAGAGLGEENSVPMLRGFLNIVPIRNSEGEATPIPPFVFWQSNYDDNTGELSLYNTGDSSGSRNAILAKHRRTGSGQDVIEGTLTTAHGKTKFSVKKVLE